MVQKFTRRVESFLAGRPTLHSNTFSTLRDRRRFVYEIREIVTLNLFLNGSKQNGFLHKRFQI
jgi:hypothetical protein